MPVNRQLKAKFERARNERAKAASVTTPANVVVVRDDRAFTSVRVVRRAVWNFGVRNPLMGKTRSAWN